MYNQKKYNLLKTKDFTSTSSGNGSYICIVPLDFVASQIVVGDKMYECCVFFISTFSSCFTSTFFSFLDTFIMVQGNTFTLICENIIFQNTPSIAK